MKKYLKLVSSVCLTIALAAGCAPTTPEATPPPSEPANVESNIDAGSEDVATSASPKESSNPDDLLNGLSANGYWIFSVLSDVTLNQPLNVDGVFYDKDDTTSRVYRKLALYSQDSDRNVTANFTLTVPVINVTSPNFLIQNGSVLGNIHVNAEGFTLNNTVVEGDITFETQEMMDSADLESGVVTGSVTVAAGADATTSASPKESSDPEALVNGLSGDGYWIFSILSDVTLDQPLNVDGVFHDKDDASARVYRKLALYAQDSERNVTAEYTLSVPEMNVLSPNFLIQNGTVKGNINVKADGFTLNNAKVEGDIVFETQEHFDSAQVDEALVSGSVSVR